MKCPICAVDLQLAERYGIEIDFCPKCRGVWLDSSETDEIIQSMPPRIRETVPILHTDNEKNKYNKRTRGYSELTK